MHTHSYSLPNKLRVLLIDTKAFPSITTLLLVKAGSRYETLQNNGIAHFFEHMAFKGSKKYPNAQALAEIIEGRGGVFNAFTSDDHTGYYVKAPAQEAETVIDVIGDMIQHPLLDSAEIEREKGVIIQEMNMYEDMPQRTIYEIFESLLFEDHPLGFKIIGTKDSVQGATRKTFTDYIEDWYHPNNAVLIVAGGLTSLEGKTIETYRKTIDKRFGAWKSAQAPEYPLVVNAQTTSRGHIQYKKTEQAHFVYGFRSFARTDERKTVLKVLSALLGMGMSSRLFREVREKRGLCYTVHTFAEFYDDAGYLGTYAGVEPKEAKVHEALEVIGKEHMKLTTELVPRDELDRAKELIKGHLILSLEDTFNVAAMYGTKQLFEGEEFKIESFMRDIEAVTAKQIRDLAQELFVQKNLNIALIGPFKDKEMLNGHLV